MDLSLVSATYGLGYVPFLGVHLEAAVAAYPAGIRHVIAYSDIPQRVIDAHRQAYPHATFVELPPTLVSSNPVVSSRKVKSWAFAASQADGDFHLLLDTDAVLVRPVDDVLPDVDVLVTWKDEIVPINAGVLGVSAKASDHFFESWIRATDDIAGDLRATDSAVLISGAVDQHSLRELVGWANYETTAARHLNGIELVVGGAPCAVLNETRSKAISSETRIVHFKAGWHRVLLHGQAFPAGRSAEDSDEMHRFWLKVRADWEARIGATDPQVLPLVEEALGRGLGAIPPGSLRQVPKILKQHGLRGTAYWGLSKLRARV